MTVGSTPGLRDVGEYGKIPLVVIVTGVWGEAKGVIEGFALAPHQPAPGITVYGDADIIAGVCGKGPESARRYGMELALWLDQTNRAKEAVWLNYGSAGSADHEPGTMVQGVRVGAVQSQDAGKFRTGEFAGIPGVSVRTHESPDSGYNSGMVHDMEAAGFIQGISAVVDNPNIYILKLVCDGPDHPWQETDKHKYQALLDGANENLLRLVDIIRRGKN